MMIRIYFAFSFLMLVHIGFAQTKDSAITQLSYSEANKNESKIQIVTQLQMDAKSDYDKGYELNNINKFSESVPYLLKAIEIDASGNCGSGINGTAYNELGYAYTRLNQYDSALHYLNLSIEANSLNPKPYLNQSVVYMQQKKFDDAIQSLEKFKIINPEFATIYAQLGFVYKAAKNKEKALLNLELFLQKIKETHQEENAKAMKERVEKSIQELNKSEIK